MYPRITPNMEPEKQAWTAGWDYITDLFRLLEYAIFSLRGSKNRKAVLSVFCERPSPTTLLDALARLKASKPRILHDLVSDFQSNRCRYMAVQITCTETLVNIMALLYCQAPASEIMEVAETLIEEIEKDHGRHRIEAERLIAFLGDLVKNLEYDIPSAAEAAERLQRLVQTDT
jgi:hypothetical protein